MSTDYWVGFAFRKGNPKLTRERVIMAATWGGFVHCELLLGHGDAYRAYSAYENIGGMLPSSYPEYKSDWVVVKYPLVNKAAYDRAYSWVLSILDMRLPYNSQDLWQCCLKIMLPFEADLPCQHPERWSAAFCSQLCLLFMRRLLVEGMVRAVPNPTRYLVHNTNSRGCSPNTLFQILVRNRRLVT